MKKYVWIRLLEDASRVVRCTATGKKKMTRAQAKNDAKYLKSNKKYPDAVPVAYKCPRCGSWHVGNL